MTRLVSLEELLVVPIDAKLNLDLHISNISRSICLEMFPVKFTKFLRTPFLTEHLRWLLLHIDICSKSTKYVNMVTRVVS